MAALDGKIAVIAGGTGGFGEGVARRFLAEGATVVVAARDRTRLDELAGKTGVTPMTCDITSSDRVRELAEQVVARQGRLDIAVNTAGYSDMCPIAELEAERVERMVAVQYTGALYFIQHMANAMARGGSLITISSLTGAVVAEGHAPYAGAKAGINHVTKIAASEYGAKGIRINVVSPTLIETPMLGTIPQFMKDAMNQETPLGRFGEIDDVVDAVQFLASDQSSYITGQNLLVDGGTSLRRLPRAQDFARAAKAAARS